MLKAVFIIGFILSLVGHIIGNDFLAIIGCLGYIGVIVYIIIKVICSVIFVIWQVVSAIVGILRRCVTETPYERKERKEKEIEIRNLPSTIHHSCNCDCNKSNFY